MLKVKSADYESGNYLISSSVTGLDYKIENHDGLLVGTKGGESRYVVSPTMFTVRECVNEGAALQKIKRRISAIERDFITTKLKG